MCEGALTAIYHFKKVGSFDLWVAFCQLPVFFPRKKWNMMAVSKSLETLGDSSPIVCFFPPKINVGPTGI
jgi:hypothetical protein